jgi:hypothetical protein
VLCLSMYRFSKLKVVGRLYNKRTKRKDKTTSP